MRAGILSRPWAGAGLVRSVILLIFFNVFQSLVYRRAEQTFHSVRGGHRVPHCRKLRLLEAEWRNLIKTNSFSPLFHSHHGFLFLSKLGRLALYFAPRPINHRGVHTVMVVQRGAPTPPSTFFPPRNSDSEVRRFPRLIWLRRVNHARAKSR